MAGIKLLDKSSATINFIINEMLKPEVHKVLFDDSWGLTELSMLMYDPRTVVYGIMWKGLPEPIGVVYFTNTIPYRDAILSAVIFDPANRKQGIMAAQAEIIKNDIQRRFAVHSISSMTIGDNKASKNFLAKLGFKKVGVKERVIFADGDYRDMTIYYMLLEKQKEA